MGTVSQVKTQSAKICLNFNFLGGRGVLRQVKTQSAKICLNSNFRGWGGGGVGYSQPSQNSKCQDLPKFQILGGWGGTVSQVKTQSAKFCLNFNFRGGGGGYCQPSQNSKCQVLPKFQCGGGGVLSAKSKLKVPSSA